MLGEVLAGIAVRGILGGTVQPAVDDGAGLGGLAVEYQVMQPQDSAGPQHQGDPVKGERLPEVG